MNEPYSSAPAPRESPIRGWIPVAALLLLSFPVAADEVVFQDGRTETAKVVSIGANEVDLEGKGRHGIEMVRTLTFHPVAPATGGILFALHNGDRIRGTLGEAPEHGIAIEHALAGRIQVALKDVAMIDYGGAHAIPETAATDEDVLFAVGKDDKLVELRGAVELIAADGITFFYKLTGSSHKVPRGKLRALRLGGKKRDDRPSADSKAMVAAVLVDDTRLSLESIALTADAVELGYAGEQRIKLRRADLARVEVDSDWIWFLGTAKPSRVERDRLYEHKLEGVDWPAYVANATIYNGPLAPQRSGIGTYGTTRLAYDLRRRYRALKAVVWVATPPGLAPERSPGEVIFRVYVDGKVKLDSGPMRATAARKPIEVDVTDGAELVLEVDRGPGWGIGDAGTWGDARLHK